LGIFFVSSGEMYRAAAWLVVRAGVPREDEAEIAAQVGTAAWRLATEGRRIHLLAGEIDPGEELRSERVNAAVSYVARIPAVRQTLLGLQRSCSQLGDLLMEGRDIGSVVFPRTPYKFYLDATESERARRRAAQGEADALQERDRIDSTRTVAPLCVAEGATVIDTTSLNIEGVVEEMLEHLRRKGFPSG
jgi:cytidylate kinase